MPKTLTTDKEIKQFLEGKINKILEEKKKERELKKEEFKKAEEKKIAEQKTVDSVKKSLHETLKNVDWEGLDIKSTKTLIKDLNKWVKQYTKK